MNERNKTPGTPKRDAHAIGAPREEAQVADGPPHAMCTLVFELPPAQIVHFKAVIESYDNLATLRTRIRAAIGSNFISRPRWLPK